MIINGIELELDLLDANVADQIEASLQKLNKRAEPKEGLGNIIRYQCEVIQDFFEEIFGQGVNDAIFEGRLKLDEHFEAFACVIQEIENTTARMTEMKEKHFPVLKEMSKTQPMTKPVTKKKFKTK